MKFTEEEFNIRLANKEVGRITEEDYKRTEENFLREQSQDQLESQMLPWESMREIPKKQESDGGSSDYYLLPSDSTELKHLISAKGMSFARGNIFKACYRLGEKEGTDVFYDLNKIKFFVEDLIRMYHKGEKL